MRKIFLVLLVCLFIVSTYAGDVYQTQRRSWLEKADIAKPVLFKTNCQPICLVKSVQDSNAFQGWKMERIACMDSLYKVSFKTKKEAIADFGRHLTGSFSFRLKSMDNTPDAPVRLKFTFAEVPAELNTPFDPYPGVLSRAWLQDEIITISQFEKQVTIPRRFAFRYLKIELLGASPYFDFTISEIKCTATTSAESVTQKLADTTSPVIREINRVSLETLKECMQSVFEDGPKRDSRLWIGDFYLQSLVNTYTFKNQNLTKRCLYLLAGLAADDGRLHADVFELPNPHPQLGVHCMDYSLLFNSTLLEYLKATNDKEAALDLWPVVQNQVNYALGFFKGNNIFDPSATKESLWLFFDWNDKLDKTVAMQGLMIFTLNNSYQLARLLNKEQEVKEWVTISEKLVKAAKKEMFVPGQGVFLSGSHHQLSYMSQVWMILSDALSPSEGQKALKVVMESPLAIYPVSPYAYHYVIEAMIKCNMKNEAKKLLVDYWGSMVNKGADTFWEVYDTKNDYLSPYNFYPVNSYCHAWSCTPSYFIQKYPDIFQK